MLQDFIDMIGEYEPIITELPDGSFDVSINWTYLALILFLVIAFYGFLKIFGRLVCGRDGGRRL